MAWEWSQFWIYVVGPVCGAVVGALLYQFVRGEHGETRVSAQK